MAKNYAVQGHLRSPILLRSKACDFLLVINTNLPLILDRFQVMADYMSNFTQRQVVAAPQRPRWGDFMQISP